MTAFDEIAQASADEECRSWLSKFFDSKQEIVDFVAKHRPGHCNGEYEGFLKGSFNFCACVRFEDGGKTLIRFPKPGHTLTSRRDEKVKNEVSVLEYIREKTTIPVPRVIHWGLTDESPAKLGPFIIMERLEGADLAGLLQKPVQSEDEDVVLRDDVDNAKLDYVFEQLADYLIQLSRLDFEGIGSISKDPATGKWLTTGRLFTYNMNELGTVLGIPEDTFPTGPFHTTNEYLEYQSNEHLHHLRTQRNIAGSPGDAQKKWIARHQFKRLIPRFCMNDSGPFKLFCEDLQPSNMLADPKTYKINAILDWEFTHAMPAQFSYDPPWWLILKGPDFWLEWHSIEDFLSRYEPRLEQFLRALERVETAALRIGEMETDEMGTDEMGTVKMPMPLLSIRMRESWKSGQFWFDYGIRKSLDVDAVYWSALHREGDDVLDEDERKEMEDFVESKMKDVKAYDRDCKERGF